MDKTKYQEVRLRFKDHMRDVLWIEKEAYRESKGLKILSWENYFLMVCMNDEDDYNAGERAILKASRE